MWWTLVEVMVNCLAPLGAYVVNSGNLLNYTEETSERMQSSERHGYLRILNQNKGEVLLLSQEDSLRKHSEATSHNYGISDAGKLGGNITSRQQVLLELTSSNAFTDLIGTS